MIPSGSGTEEARRLAEAAVGAIRRAVDGADAATRLTALKEVLNQLVEEVAALSSIEERVRTYTHRIPGARTVEELGGLHRTLNALAVELFRSDHSVPELLELCTAYRDLLSVQALRLVERELGPPPCAYAVGCMGSEGRREQTVATDQDNMLVYQAPEGREYFQRFGRAVNACLEQIGLARCTGGIMMGEPAWQGTFGDWKDRIDRTVAFQGKGSAHRKQLLDLMVLSDLRFVHGARPLLQQVASHLFGRLHANVPVLYDMAVACVSMPVGLGLFGKFRAEKSGPHKGRFSVKLLGWAPLVLAVRVLALKEKIYETNTVRRIEALRLHNRIDAALEASLVEAYTVLTRLKVECQLGASGAAGHDTYYVDPEALDPTRRDALRRALHTVESFQKLAYNSFMLR
ncbi:MAG: DUF294 nucleotidyltransferase-like domain-containing protein [Deferrisomatales bacterium]